jgi:O-antigen ligase
MAVSTSPDASTAQSRPRGRLSKRGLASPMPARAGKDSGCGAVSGRTGRAFPSSLPPSIMTKTADNPPTVFAAPAAIDSWHGVAARFLLSDGLAVLAAMALPWSTTAVAWLVGLFLGSLVLLLPTLQPRAWLRLLADPICLWPLALLALALLGTLWAEGPWRDRLHGVSPVVKLLAIPFLLYHFERSRRGAWVFSGFLISCALLMVLSWLVLYFPELKLSATANAGVPVKNYIDQSQAFALCMVALLPFVLTLVRLHRHAAAAACAALALGFAANMAFVVSARAAFIYVPVLLVVFALMHLRRRESVLLFAGVIVAATAVWFTSPYLRDRIADIAVEYREYQQNIPGSTGRRLEYWQKSLGFIAQAPLLGNGTGSTQALFERDAAGQTGLAAEITRNPHNQTLNVAVQWGLVGVMALYAMWLTHLRLFRGPGLASWIGLLVVVQNVASSLFNSHLFDFVEGWMYVFGVGVAGGMSLRAAPGRVSPKAQVNGATSAERSRKLPEP